MQTTQLIHELAEAGSIEALVERHAGLGRHEVEQALEYVAQLAEREEVQRESLSPVYRIYNGFLLGLFTGGFILFGVRGEPDHQKRTMKRITEFLLELVNEFGAELDLQDAENLEDGIDKIVRELDSELADCYQLGLVTFQFMVGQMGTEEPDTSIREAQELLHKLGYPPVLFQAVIDAAAAHSGDESPTAKWTDMMTGCLRLAREVLLGLSEEGETCFVALPFAAPYENRYLNYYRGVARMMEKRSIRAWGSLGGEDHQEMLMALISRCGAMLADVTEPNANVTLEVGFALGQNKKLYLVAEGENWKKTANIQLDWVCPYTPTEGEWEFPAAEQAGLYFTTLEASRRPGPVPSWSVKPMDVLNQLSEAMKFAREGQS